MIANDFIATIKMFGADRSPVIRPRSVDADLVVKTSKRYESNNTKPGGKIEQKSGIL